jgi:hypothetical protein
MRIPALFLLASLAAALLACSSPASDRMASVAELSRFATMVGGRLRCAELDTRLAALRTRTGPYLTHEEVSWLLVPALGLDYRLRHGDSMERCQELLEAMGLLRPGSGLEPVSITELRRLLNRAALPETELVLPGAGPLPSWLNEP